MADLWYFLVALLFAVYIALDGFDFGVGVLHLFVARTPKERSQVLRSIGPVWDGNEVWLVAAGATLLCAFPALFSSMFSGFYLPLMLVLWLLIFRALGIEMKHQSSHPLWGEFWDVAFAASSTALALCFGAALGNLLRGLPLEDDGTFFLPLWSNFGVGESLGVLDWYTVLVGGHAVLALAVHGALWLVARTDGRVHERARTAVGRLLPAAAASGLIATAATYWVHPEALLRLLSTPGGLAIVLASSAALGASYLSHRRDRARVAFRTFGVHLVVTIFGAAFAIHPSGLPAFHDLASIPLAELAASNETLRGTLWWWLPGITIASLYSFFSYRLMPKTFGAEADDAH